MANLAVLVSGKGSTLDNLCQNNLPVKLVISSNYQILSVVDKWKIDWAVLSDSQKIFAICDVFEIDLVVLAGWNLLLTLPPNRKVINIHPSLLPKFGGKGYYGLNVHRAVLEAKEKETGCTVHWVDEEYDHGEIIVQERIKIVSTDTPEILQERVKQLERIVYPKVIKKIIDDFMVSLCWRE